MPLDPDMGEHRDGDRRGRHAAQSEAAHDDPVDGAVEAVHDDAAALGHRGIEQIGADRRRRVDPEQQHQDRRHQRAATDSRQPDEGTDDEAAEGIAPLDVHGTIVSLRGACRPPCPRCGSTMDDVNPAILFC